MVSFISAVSLFLRFSCSRFSHIPSLSLSQMKIQMEASIVKNSRNAYNSYKCIWLRTKLRIFSTLVTLMEVPEYNSTSLSFSYVSFIFSKMNIHPLYVHTNYYPPHTHISLCFQSVGHNHPGGLLQKSKLGSPQLEATFDTIIQAFIFLDKNGDGKLNRKEMVKALNEASPYERSPARITKTRFSISPFIKDTPYSCFCFYKSFLKVKTICQTMRWIHYSFELSSRLLDWHIKLPST